VNQNQAKSTLLVRAVELADPSGILVPHAVRERCTVEAAPPDAGAGAPHGRDDPISPDEEDFLGRRAALVEAELRNRSEELTALVDGPDPHWWIGFALMGLAFGAGLLFHEISPDRRLNLLAFPLLGLIAWNLAVYVALLVRRLAAPHDKRSPGRFATMLADWLGRVRLPRPPTAHGPETIGAPEAIATKAAARFLRDWGPLQAPLALARARTMLHAGALFMTVGAATGLVFRGVYLAYLAGWESTFLGAEAVRAILATILYPASLLTGISIPDGVAFEALQFRPGFDGESARQWILLYVVAAGLYVVLPRLLLASAGARRSHSLRRDFYHPPRADRYFHRLLQANRGGGEVATILWHGIVPTAGQRARVRTALQDAIGGRVTLEFLDPVEYGEEASVLEKLSTHAPRERMVAVFSLAATPEEEVHGALLRQLASHGPRGEEQPPLVVLDAAPLERFAADPAFRSRYDDRLRSWARFVEAHHAKHIVLDTPDTSIPPARTSA